MTRNRPPRRGHDAFLVRLARRTSGPNSFSLMLLALAAACGSKSDQTGLDAGSSVPGASSQNATGGSAGAAPTSGNSTTGAGGTGSPSGMPRSRGTAVGGSDAGGNAGTMTNAGDSGASGGPEAGSTPFADAAGTTPTVACNPPDKLPDATPVMPAFNGGASGGVMPGTPPVGPYNVVAETDPGIPDHTVWRPDPLDMLKRPIPILAWGMGGCAKDSTGNGLFAALEWDFVSQGILLISDGTPGGTGPSSGDSSGGGGPLLAAIDWAQKENERPCSKYYHKLDVTKVGVSGQSCGGLMAINAATDPRITTSVPLDSGLFSRDPTLYAALHAPMAIIDAGPDDIAYSNGQADFMAIDNIPIMFANYPISGQLAHIATYMDPNAGEFGKFTVAWLRWWLLDDLGATGKGMFIGANCGFCGTMWDMQWKNEPM